MKLSNTHISLFLAIIAFCTASTLDAQSSDAPTIGECIKIEMSQTKDKVLNMGLFAPNNDAWIDLNGDGECQVNERVGRSSDRPDDYTDVFYMGPTIESFALTEDVQTLNIYGQIEAIRFENSETNSSPKVIDLTQCTQLHYFQAYECSDLEGITFPREENDCCEVLYIKYTPLKALDLSRLKSLIVLVASFNKNLETIQLSECPKMDVLDLSFTKIPKVDLSKTTALTELYLCQTAISEIDLTPTPNLDLLSLGANYLTSIDLRNVPDLTYLSLFDNNLTKIDVSKLSKLQILELEQNQISTLDLSKNSQLRELTVHVNTLTALDLSALTKLHLLTLYDNNIPESMMGEIVAKIPECKPFDPEGEDEPSNLWGNIYVVNTPSPKSNVCNTLQIAELKKKGWTPYDANGGDPQDFESSSVEYEGSTPSAVCDPIESDNVHISYTATGAHIQGLAPHTSVVLFDMRGEMLQRYNSLSSTEGVSPTASYSGGSYIITVAGKSYKIALY